MNKMTAKEIKPGKWAIYSSKGTRIGRDTYVEFPTAMLNDFLREDPDGTIWLKCFRQSANRGSNAGAKPSVYWRQLKS